MYIYHLNIGNTELLYKDILCNLILKYERHLFKSEEYWRAVTFNITLDIFKKLHVQIFLYVKFIWIPFIKDKNYAHS